MKFHTPMNRLSGMGIGNIRLYSFFLLKRRKSIQDFLSAIKRYTCPTTKGVQPDWLKSLQ